MIMLNQWLCTAQSVKSFNILTQVFLGMLFYNENTNEGIQTVLEAVHTYVACLKNEDEKAYPSS